MRTAALSITIATLLLATAAVAGVPEPDPGGARAPSGGAGAARAAEFLAAYDSRSALESAAFADGFSRSPGGAGYTAVLDRFASSLRSAGFGVAPGLRLELLETPLKVRAWTANAGRVTLLAADGDVEVLHAFSRPGDVDRAIVPHHAPAVDLTAEVVFELDDVVPGTILVTESQVRPDLLRRARRRGAVAIVSSSLATFNVDADGGAGHLSAIQLRELPPGTRLPVMQISPGAYAEIREAKAPRLALFADVVHGPELTHTLVATIDGIERGDEVVVLLAHLQGAGASDAAGAAAGLLEAARTAARMLRSGAIERPMRSVAFVFGPELAQARAWLGSAARLPIASFGMLGVGTGALVLERAPEPGGVRSPVAPNALTTVARCAIADVAEASGGWRTTEQAYEGGSGGDAFLAVGVPTVLLWSPPDFAARTSLDRFERIDGEELRRGSVAALLAAWAIADPNPEDLSRYILRLESERRERIAWALRERDTRDAERWQVWFEGAAAWLVRGPRLDAAR